MNYKPNQNLYRIVRHAGNQGSRLSVVHQAVDDKFATGSNTKTKTISKTKIKTKTLFKCKKLCQIATFNVQTLNGLHKMGELPALAKQFNIDIICIQEHRIIHEEEIKFHCLGKGWMLATSSAWKNSIGAANGGVGILMSPKAFKSLKEIESISNRLLKATLNGNPIPTIISCYSPTNVSEDEEAINFYHDLSDAISNIPKHNILLIGGDMNAKLSKGDFPHSFHNETNRNGRLFHEVIEEYDLLVTNTIFEKRNGKKWTFIYPNKTKAQIDYIVINRKWKNSVLNSEPYNSFSSMASDHRIVTARFRLSLRSNKNQVKKQIYDYNYLINDKNVKQLYAIEVKNRFEILNSLDTTQSSETMYNNIMSAHQEAAKKTIPLKQKKKKRVPWEDENIIEKRKNLKRANDQKQNYTTPENTLKYEIAQNDLINEYAKNQEKYINQKINEIKSASEQHKSRVAWNIVNEVSGRKTSNTVKIKSDSPEESVLLWKTHFQNLLGQPPDIIDEPTVQIVNQELHINTNNFSIVELNTCIKSLSNNKAAGLEEVPAEVWKNSSLKEPLLAICNKVLNTNTKPSIWAKSAIIPIPKKGDLSIAANYRGISLTCIAAKIFNKMLSERIRPYLEPILRINQNGFRPGRSTVSQILVLRRLIEGIKEKNLTAVITFVDFKKAFDSIHRRKMFEILKAYGVPEKICKAVETLYKDTSAQVFSPDGETDFF